MSTEISLDPSETWKYLSPKAIPANVPTTGEDNSVIAPWLAPDEPPSPPPKLVPTRSLGFNAKRSFANIGSSRHAAASTTTLHSRSRASDTASVTEGSTYTLTDRRIAPPELRKQKTMNSFFNVIKKKASRVGRDDNASSLSLSPPPVPSPAPSLYAAPISPPPPPKKVRRRNYPKSPGQPPLPSKEPEFTLDTNLDEMDGIVDLTVHHDILPPNGNASSPGSGFETSNVTTSSLSISDGGLFPQPSASSIYQLSTQHPMFSNPFLPSSSSSTKRRPGNLDFRKVSPKTVVPAPSGSSLHESEQHSPGWVAPESWAVEKEGEIPDVPDYYTSSDDDDPTGSRSHAAKPSRRRTRNPKRAQSLPTYQIRIHRVDGSYHVVKCPLTTTVADLSESIKKRLVLDETRETHSLYVKERERERVLAATERPADLVRRRLEQAGYDVADGLQTLGAEEIGFLIKFIYKSNLLGGAGQEDFAFEKPEYIDLTGRSLKTIPIKLHTLAQKMISLNLSRNPMLEIPLDFIQSCVTLRELRLSNMAMKKVPQSVRHSISLHRLDISCNRIADLDDSGLDRIPQLSNLKAQNNRMDRLPTFFPSLRALKYLNISNNKFRSLPSVIPEMTNLVDLDVSFNNISVLPETIGQLRSLERFIIVGNQISQLPTTCQTLVSLVTLDCRRNNISDLSLVCRLPRLLSLHADHNAVHALDLAVGHQLQHLDVSFNDITQLTIGTGLSTNTLANITSLNISHAKLSSIDSVALSHLIALDNLRLDHNAFRIIPDTLGCLTELKYLSCSDNQLDALPDSIGDLQKLTTLDVHNNSLTELPASMWQCGSLMILNVTSNLLKNWHDPPTPIASSDNLEGLLVQKDTLRKASTAGSIASSTTHGLPPLASSLQRLYLGENRLTEDVLHPLTALRQLRVLNLSFNEIQELPATFFRNFGLLEEIYLSGNKLSSIPTEDMPRLANLTVMFLNGNKLQTLPHEFTKLTNLTILDVGSNLLKYNINNWEFDWNWNFNKSLKYLNLSGNKRLKIQPDTVHRFSMIPQQQIQSMQRRVLADFADLTQLRVLGLMDVTVTTATGIPEDCEDRRVRTSLSEVNRMPYGIADTLGKKDYLGMLDVVLPEYRGKSDECIFAMFGRFDTTPMNNRVSKYLCENFTKVFTHQLDRLDRGSNEGVPDALRRTFLALNKNMHAFLTVSANLSRKMSTASGAGSVSSLTTDLALLRNGASGIVVYFVGKTFYVANAGDALAVISRQGTAHLVSQKHEPFDRGETARIRAAEGWVSPRGLVNEEIEVSRSFGFYHLLPAVNPRPDIFCWELSEGDEFIIIANRGLWDYVSYRTAVDIARSERADPMIAAQKLRDFAMSYGADGSTMIMVINVSALFEENVTRSRQATVGSINDTETYLARKPRQKTQDIGDVALARLPQEILAPTGYVALVFTDIRNSTILWETNAAMPTAMRLHNTLLRRQLRLCGGYEVKTEGDAFMCAFQSVMAALLWCLTVQRDLLYEPWPSEILNCSEGREIKDSRGKIIERGLSVRMGIHCGTPVCEPDPITHRMDYFGPMVNRSARIESSASGGQIMCSADVMREIQLRVLSHDLDFELDSTNKSVIDGIRRINIEIVDVGETRLKGLEVPEYLSLVYPAELVGRQEYREPEPEDIAPTDAKARFTASQVREIGILCVRLETLASSRILRPPARKGSTATARDEPIVDSDGVVVYADPSTLLPVIQDKASEEDLLIILDSFSSRIENALTKLTLRCMGDKPRTLLNGLQRGVPLDERALLDVLTLLQSVLPLSTLPP